MSAETPASAAAMQQGFEQLKAGAFEDAIDSFTACLAIQPRQSDGAERGQPDAALARRGRGMAFQQLQRWAEAAEDFSAARDLAPQELDNWVDLGISLSGDKRFYPALEVFDTLLAQHPTYFRGHLEVGLLHVRLGAIPKGREHLQRALTCRPTSEQRRKVEALLGEQARMDHKRWYRPDFEALHRQEQVAAEHGWPARLRRWWQARRSASSK